ncbi:hypothetical protein CAPTEDRAFT_206559 [Capitella teleta]|uniref:G-protein coupled receptors family 1 profile domain-containing protein n=1 Tax=Capitella teleta TaxID=283909 RepID=R7U202_CAPTE|nr:hypothetical protein CAPTEDRAFT_206559 [Capitella teleta]|eukprot:ELU00015.1 hypothetical protein CAPTEDRAFT_206559 [Capitella teleta]
MDSTTSGDFTTTESSGAVYSRLCVLFPFIFMTLGGGCVIIIGLLGNCLSLTILGKERKKSSTIQALCLLAVADSLVLVSYISLPIISKTKSINLGVFAGVYLFEAARAFNQVSACLTMILMWQRYVAVCLPHKAKQLCTASMVNRIAACTSLAAFVFYLPNFFLYTIKTRANGYFYAHSNYIVHNAYFQMIYSVILTYLVSYIIPVVSLLYMSVAILKSLKSHSNTVAPSANSQHARKDLTKSSIAIVIIYVICQSFQPIRRILMWVYDPYMMAMSCGGDLFMFALVPHFAIMFNSSANFGIYILFARGFRRKLIAILIRRNAVGPNDSTTNNTKAGTSTTTTNVSAANGICISDKGSESVHAIPLSDTITNRASDVELIGGNKT